MWIQKHPVYNWTEYLCGIEGKSIDFIFIAFQKEVNACLILRKEWEQYAGVFYSIIFVLSLCFCSRILQTQVHQCITAKSCVDYWVQVLEYCKNYCKPQCSKAYHPCLISDSSFFSISQQFTSPTVPLHYRMQNKPYDMKITSTNISMWFSFVFVFLFFYKTIS